MGVVFREHMGGPRPYSCRNCYTNITNRAQLMSTRFQGGSGPAFLFHKAVNIKLSATHDRVMITGRHIIRDVHCKNCDRKLGWMYELAFEKDQEYKEGKVILEKALIKEVPSIEEHV